MKYIEKIFIISFLILILIYVSNITNIPEQIILFQGEHYALKTALGITVDKKESNFLRRKL